MKKQLFKALLFCLLAMPAMSIRADVIDEGQSTEGKDFWVTFLKADSYDGDDKPIELSLSISAKEACDVTIENKYSGFSKTISLAANELHEEPLYTGTAKAAASTKDVVKCYSIHNEVIDTTAIHVTSTGRISLFASNWKSKSFDATNVLPTPSLLDEYYIQSYPPSAHGGDTQQGTHFAIVAAEDNTVVEYVPTVQTEGIRDFLAQYNNWGDQVYEIYPQYERFRNFHNLGDTILSDTLMAGQVWYVWTGIGGGDDYDLSGTYIKARDEKKIAVFQGAPHTNIPHQIRDRDHIFSQAMPTKYWGNTFAITSSMTRGRDKIRIMALNDETEVRINGQLVHTFHFATDNTPSGAKVVQCTPKNKRTFEFEIGQKGTNCTDKDNKFSLADPLVEGTSCFIETSCPVAVHLFMVSNKYDDTDKADPAMLWINPIEQVIDNITFATYNSSNTHYFNVVTTKDNINNMQLDGNPLTGFSEVVGSNDQYYFARQNIPHGTHTLSGTKGFIAHVYGYGERESYGYSAGGATVPLSQSIYINGEEFSPDKENNLCGKDTVHFACKPDFMPDSVIWHFGDGTPDVVLIQDTTTIVKHYFNGTQDFQASCSIYRNSSNVCVGQSAVTVIPITVRIGRYSFSIGQPDIPCPENGVQAPGKIPYTSTIDLTGKNVTVDFDDAAKAAGFVKTDLSIKPSHFELHIPSTAEPGVLYGIQIDIQSDCGDTTAVLPFRLPVGNDVIAQRYNNVLGLLKDHPQFKGLTLSDFQWFRVSDSTAIEGQVSSNLNMYDLPKDSYKDESFYVCYYINKGLADETYTCACAKMFGEDASQHSFEVNPDSLIITANYDLREEKIFVNANYRGEKDIECYAQWITSSGNIYGDLKFNIPDGGCTIPTPNENGLYLLRVVTDGKTRSFKFVINK